MEDKSIKNAINYKYSDFKIGDKIKFGKWNDDYGNKTAIWTVLKKIDFSNLSEDDNRFLDEFFGTTKNQYDGKALIVKMHAGTKVYYGVDFIKDENLPRGGYLNFHYNNEWFDEKEFPIVLSKNEDELILKSEYGKGFISYDGDAIWESNSDYLGKDLLFEEYNDGYKLLYYIGDGDDTDLECNWNIDISDKTKDGLFKYSEDNFYFKTNTFMYCKNKCGGFKEVSVIDFINHTSSIKKEYENPSIEEYTAFDELYGWYHDEILELVEECNEDEEDFFCGKSWYNIIKLLVIKVKD